ncbi:MAG: hypothetical protein IKO27_09530 [Ruminococcus sp.]|nr:hypothetical protein [Ruminococcus sp.]
MTAKTASLSGGYVRIDCGGSWECYTLGGDVSFGGDQGWFGNEDGYIRPLGCGLISCADILLYRTGRRELVRDEYTGYVRSLEKDRLKVRKKLGLNGLSMARGMNRQFRALGLGLKAGWGFSKKKIMPRILEMLGQDIPVTLSVGPHILFKKKDRPTGVNFYIRTEEGFVLPHWRSGLVKEHYVTVTAVVETPDRTMLEISSWGERYYIDWAEYEAYINTPGTFFSNVLYIK